jgi:hypothetical protein
MAEQNYGGLASTFGPEEMAKVPMYGGSDSDLQDLKEAQTQALNALQQRYANPNWFKIAAGFAKPQLGGFAASLGSASDAMGDWVEQQRAQELPIAELRAKLAQTNRMMGVRQEAAQIAAQKNLTPDQINEITLRDPALGKSLQESQASRAATVANNINIAKNNAAATGTPMPVLNEMGLPETGSFPPSVDTSGRVVPEFKPLQGGAWTNGIGYNESRNNPNSKNKESTASGTYGVLDSTAQNPGYGIAPAKDNSVAEKDRVGKEYSEAMTKLYGPSWGALAVRYGPNQVEEWKKLGDLSQLPAEAKQYVGQAALAQFPGGNQIPNQSDTHQPSQRAMLDFNIPTNAVNPYGNTSAGIAQTIKDRNDSGKAYLAELDANGNPKNNAISQSVITNLEQSAENPRFDKTMALLADHGLLSAVAHFVQQGGDVSIGDMLHTHIGVDLQGALRELQSKADREFANELFMNFSKMALQNQRAMGVNPNSVRNSELGTIAASSPDASTLPETARLWIRNSNLYNHLDAALWNNANQLQTGTHKDYVLNPNSAYPAWDIKNHPSNQAIIDQYKHALASEHQKFLDRTSKLQ